MQYENDPSLKKIEEYYLKINELEYQIGSAYDYLDSGGSSDDQEIEAYVKFSDMFDNKDVLSEEYDRLLQNLRTNEELFLKWVLLHIGIYESLQDLPEHDDEYNTTRAFVIGEAIGLWRNVSLGDDSPIIINSYFTPEVNVMLREVFEIDE